MRILDQNNNELHQDEINYNLGYLIEENIFIQHHDAIQGVKEEWHYETVAEYPNGGRDVKKIIDVEGVEAKEAWDEYEDILRYTLYTEEELAEKEAERKKEEEEQKRLNLLIMNGVTWDELADAYFKGVEEA